MGLFWESIRPKFVGKWANYTTAEAEPLPARPFQFNRRSRNFFLIISFACSRIVWVSHQIQHLTHAWPKMTYVEAETYPTKEA